ncbi:Xaa-Pro aminopeptidase [sulfur-oxidizing endosymbiont of Gigantopelta aegis]|uniref:Xaa-Pro aminopeptidase n=1 Tax=sulfur-oxidizing endosymbiont of Gigantopelta aegis TaxID=2794934 RepID=UPI0018DBDBAD|nr:Xaa-Pro aminopeptidase [sulfur-oxidizing endosymbiont of Gigantopelta aegis]
MITTKEFTRRRKHLMQDMGNDSIAILPTAVEQVRNRDVNFIFRPDSDFLYLTGFWEPEAVLVLIPGRKHGEYVLFCREKDETQEIWHGRRAGQEGVLEKFAADDSFPISDIDEILPGLMENKTRVFYTMGIHADFDQRLTGWVNQLKQKVRMGVNAPGEFVALDHALHEMRLFKSASEIKMMKKAASVSCLGHERLMKICQPGLYEYQLEAEFIHHCMFNACREQAYPSIVGGGENGCILHYTENNMPLKAGDLVLIDAGGEYQGYASDITRTYPVNGRFSTEQKALYELVLEAQLAAIEMVYPGSHWNAPHEAAVKVITRGLVKLGLLKGRVDKLIKEEAYKPFYMHRTGHWLGLDVHDVGDYKIDNEWRMLEPGMVLTIEPGIYTGDNRKIAKKWRNIGIRIEDDVRVTRTGYEVLTARAAKTVDDIEALMASGKALVETPRLIVKKAAIKKTIKRTPAKRTVAVKKKAKVPSSKKKVVRKKR